MQALFESTVAALAHQAQMPAVTITVDPTSKSMACAEGRSHSIRVHPKLFDRDPEVVRWVAGHELAHLALNHRPSRWPRWVVGASAFVLLLILSPSLTWPDLVLVNGFTAICAAAIVLACADVMWSTEQRAKEQDADRLAQTWGMPLTAVVRDELVAEEKTRQGHWPPVPRFCRTHETPDKRFRACEQWADRSSGGGVRDIQGTDTRRGGPCRCRA